MTTENGDGFVVKVPRRHGGIPPGLAAAASSRDPMPLDAIEAAAIKAVRADPWRSWEFIQFGDSPLPSDTVTQEVATNPNRGPLDAARVKIVAKTVYNSASWRAAKPERFKGGRTIPAERPSVFEREADAQATLERFHRLGRQAGVPMAAHLQYGVVAPLSEWEATAGQPTLDREKAQIAAEVELESLSAHQRETLERIRELQEQFDRPTPPVRHEPVPEDPEEKRQAILAAVAAGEPQVDVARRFQVSEKSVYRYRKAAEQPQPDPIVGHTIDPSLLGE